MKDFIVQTCTRGQTPKIYYNSNTDFAIKISLTTASTTGVALTAYTTGFTGMVKSWISSLTNLIPSWLTITGNGFSINLAL